MRIMGTTSTLLQPPSPPRPPRRIEPGDVLNVLDPSLESLGLEVIGVTETSLVARSADYEIHIDFEIRRTFPPISGGAPVEPSNGNGDESPSFPCPEDPDDFDWDPSATWELGPAPDDDDSLTPPGLSPEEQAWKEQLAPFSRNAGDRTATLNLLAIGTALESYDRCRKGT